MDQPFAEDLNFWKTSRSDPGKWLERAAGQVEKLGGEVLTHAFGQDKKNGTSAYLLQFKIHGEHYKATWPVLPTKYDYGNGLAAKRQAATMLYHDIKAKCLSATVKTPRAAFLEYLVLSDGRTASQASNEELMVDIPLALQGYAVPQLEGEK